MIDSGADMNCIQEGLIPSKYFEKSTERLYIYIYIHTHTSIIGPV